MAGSDEFYLEQVRKLMGMSRMAAGEAQGWADGIQDPEIKRQAEKLLEETE